jgi:Tol biopolymer transport system component
MKVYLIVFLAALFQSGLAQNTFPLALQDAPTKASLLSEGFISTSMNERDFSLSPDGNEIYFTVSSPKSTFQTIVFCKRVKPGQWTKPEVVSFAGQFSDLEPALSVDGKTLYFASNRPLTGTTPKDFDLWKVQRDGESWGIPENLGSNINTESDEFYPSITKSGNLYFTAQYKNGIGREDIYVSSPANGSYQKPSVLDSAVNTKAYEFNAFVSPDEKFILFTSYGKDDTGGGDLYISVKDEGNKWKPAVNLRELNSPQLDYCPAVSPDGKILFFTSERHQLPKQFLNTKATYSAVQSLSTNSLNGTGNIYWVDFSEVLSKVRSDY